MDALLSLFGLTTMGDLLTLIATLCAAGAGAGVLAGFLGVGGGILLVPILFHAFGLIGVDETVRMHMAVGTSLATIIPTSIRSLRGHAQRGSADLEILRRWIFPVVGGVLLGTVIAEGMSGTVLSSVFVTLAFSVAAYLAFAPETLRIDTQMPGEPVNGTIGVGIGFFSALMGIGGGTFGVSVMTLYGQPIHRAVGTSSGLGLIISVPGALGFMWSGWGHAALPPLSLGFVHVPAVLLVVPMTLLSVPLGVALAHRLSRTLLRRAFAVFLALNAGLILRDLLGG